jgi:hypothetical protein
MNRFLLFFALFTAIALVGCDPDKKEVPQPTDSQVKLSFKAVHNEQPFAYNTIYTDHLGHRIRFENFKMYFSEINLVKSDGGKVALKDFVLINFNSPGSFNIKVQPGTYTGLELGMGVAKEFNKGQDPSQYPASHPLSVQGSAGMFWTWSTGYIFSKLEGKADLEGIEGNPLIESFAYHIGEDELYRQLTFEKSITVEAGKTTNLTLEIDTYKCFLSDFDSLDISEDGLTHTSGNVELAERVVELMVAAFSLK